MTRFLSASLSASCCPSGPRSPLRFVRALRAPAHLDISPRTAPASRTRPRATLTVAPSESSAPSLAPPPPEHTHHRTEHLLLPLCLSRTPCGLSSESRGTSRFSCECASVPGTWVACTRGRKQALRSRISVAALSPPPTTASLDLARLGNAQPTLSKPSSIPPCCCGGSACLARLERVRARVLSRGSPLPPAPRVHEASGGGLPQRKKPRLLGRSFRTRTPRPAAIAHPSPLPSPLLPPNRSSPPVRPARALHVRKRERDGSLAAAARKRVSSFAAMTDASSPCLSSSPLADVKDIGYVVRRTPPCRSFHRD